MPNMVGRLNRGFVVKGMNFDHYIKQDKPLGRYQRRPEYNPLVLFKKEKPGAVFRYCKQHANGYHALLLSKSGFRLKT